MSEKTDMEKLAEREVQPLPEEIPEPPPLEEETTNTTGPAPKRLRYGIEQK